MDPAAKEFFKQILETPSPSGYEQPVQEIVRKYAESFADEVRTDLHGNVIVGVNPKAPLRVMYAGHADQIGLIVSTSTTTASSTPTPSAGGIRSSSSASG